MLSASHRLGWTLLNLPRPFFFCCFYLPESVFSGIFATARQSGDGVRRHTPTTTNSWSAVAGQLSQRENRQQLTSSSVRRRITHIRRVEMIMRKSALVHERSFSPQRTISLFSTSGHLSSQFLFCTVFFTLVAMENNWFPVTLLSDSKNLIDKWN